MKLYVYADESGTFDKAHNDIFVYGGVILRGTENRNDATRRYVAIEKAIRERGSNHPDGTELKAAFMSLKERKTVFTSIARKGCRQFAVIVDQKKLYDQIYESKKRKQRFLDYALKRGIKEAIVRSIADEGLKRSDIDAISVVVDEHSSSTSGKYNLEESINEELRCGMFNPEWNVFFEPVFSTDMPKIPVAYANSKSVPLVRAADVTANWAFMAERDKDTYPHAYEMLSRRSYLLRLP